MPLLIVRSQKLKYIDIDMELIFLRIVQGNSSKATDVSPRATSTMQETNPRPSLPILDYLSNFQPFDQPSSCSLKRFKWAHFSFADILLPDRFYVSFMRSITALLSYMSCSNI